MEQYYYNHMDEQEQHHRLYCVCIIQRHRCRNASQWKMRMKEKKSNVCIKSDIFFGNKRGDIYA